jgi:CheY-like chemotaxis protein
MGEICLVDDEIGIVEMVRDYLSESFSVRSFTSPEEAIRAFDTNYRPDVLVTDIKMPRIDGFDLAQYARDRIPGLPVVMMSGYAEKHHILEAMDREVYGFLEKPFLPQRLKELILSGIHHARRLRGLETLVEKFNVLARTSLELNYIYINRFIAAESRAGASVSILSDQNQPYQTNSKQVQQGDLEFVANRMLQEINEILAANPDLSQQPIQFTLPTWIKGS